MENFERINLLKRQKMAIEQLVKYWAEYRKNCFANGVELKGIEFRKKINFAINLILKIDQLLSKENIVIINDRHYYNSDAPTIYACTHIGGNDIQRTFQIIDKPSYLMLGDPGILYKKLIYQGLKLNGVIPLETEDREDRKIAYYKSIELLEKGGNLLIYPEGAWNISPNSLVMKTFNGTVRIAKETGAEIIPIAVEQYNNDFYFNIGENYFIPKTTSKIDDELNIELRDKLTTLKWEILETQQILKRTRIPNDFSSTFQDEIVSRCNYGYGFSKEDALRESFHDKNVIPEDQVFEFLENIDIDPDNAFLHKGQKNLTLR